MHCTAPVIVVCFLSFLWSYSTELAEKGAWLLYSNEFTVFIGNNTVCVCLCVWMSVFMHQWTKQWSESSGWEVSSWINVKTWQHWSPVRETRKTKNPETEKLRNWKEKDEKAVITLYPCTEEISWSLLACHAPLVKSCKSGVWQSVPLAIQNAAILESGPRQMCGKGGGELSERQ